jgi:hypothetical protein
MNDGSKKNEAAQTLGKLGGQAWWKSLDERKRAARIRKMIAARLKPAKPAKK